MPNSRLTLTVVALYLSHTEGASGAPVAELRLRPNHGVEGDSHSGSTQVAENGEVVPNLRQWTAVNPRELGAVAEDLGIPFIDPAWVKANICFGWSSDAPFTQTLAPGTLLLQDNERPVLEIKGEVDPCLGMGQRIAAQFPHLSMQAQRFPKTAYGRRGVHGIVLEEMTIRLKDTFTVALPNE
ncbi:MAG TPA: hypothetical protein VKT82_21050 [Ktedonobacterales bacterium]|nr:hypothetical protein [Ktedonobacterales bacterium]